MPHPEGIFKISICGEKTAQLPIRLQARCFCQFSACMHPKIFPDSNRIRLRRSFQSYVCMFFLSNSRIRASLFTAYCHVFFIACPVLPLFLIIWGFCRALSALGVAANSAVCVVEQSDAACLRQERFERRASGFVRRKAWRGRIFLHASNRCPDARDRSSWLRAFPSGLLPPSAGLRRALPAPAQGPSALENPLRYRAYLATLYPRPLRASPPRRRGTAGAARTRSRAIGP